MPTKSGSRNNMAAQCAAAERAFIRAMTQGGSDKSTAHAVMENGLMTLTGRYVSADGKTIEQADIIGDPRQAEELGRLLAEHLTGF